VKTYLTTSELVVTRGGKNAVNWKNPTRVETKGRQDSENPESNGGRGIKQDAPHQIDHGGGYERASRKTGRRVDRKSSSPVEKEEGCKTRRRYRSVWHQGDGKERGTICKVEGPAEGEGGSPKTGVRVTPGRGRSRQGTVWELEQL